MEMVITKFTMAVVMLLLSSEFCWICPSANQLQPLPLKTDKNFLEIFMNANLSSKNRSVQPEIQLCAPVCFDGANIEFLRRKCRNKQRI